MSGSDPPSAAEFTVNEEDVSYNGALLMKHVMEKGWQTGGVLALVATPIGALRAFRQKGSWESGEAMATRALRYARKCAIPTVLATGALGLARIAQYEDTGAALADRVYRLHFNGSQNRCDQFSRIGTVVGGLSAVAGRGPSLPIFVGGAALGAGFGVLAHVVSARAA